ncbi:MAG: hypothetical protein H7276_08225, partial [Caulobacter sp.]|nr:hypothetical protein [Vitreoscilla sp.]
PLAQASAYLHAQQQRRAPPPLSPFELLASPPRDAERARRAIELHVGA